MEAPPNCNGVGAHQNLANRGGQSAATVRFRPREKENTHWKPLFAHWSRRVASGGLFLVDQLNRGPRSQKSRFSVT